MINNKKRHKENDFEVTIQLVDLSQEQLKTIKAILVDSQQFGAAHKVRIIERIIERLLK